MAPGLLLRVLKLLSGWIALRNEPEPLNPTRKDIHKLQSWGRGGRDTDDGFGRQGYENWGGGEGEGRTGFRVFAAGALQVGR